MSALRTRIIGALQWGWSPLICSVLVTAIVLLSTLASDVFQRTVTTMLIDLVLVLGLYLFVGNSGVLSFGHMSFMAVGAYLTAFLTIAPTQKQFLLPGLPGFLANSQLAPFPAALCAGGSAALLAAILAVPLMRLAGIAASLGMFAVLLIVYVTASNWDSVTRGQGALLGVPTHTTKYVALAWALGVMVTVHVFQQSPLGLRLRVSREDEVAARAVGISVFWERTVAFVLSAFIVGIGGFLFAQFLGSFNPDAFYLNITFITIAMLVIGGLTSLAGAVIGTVVVSAVLEGLRQLENGVNIGLFHVTAPAGLQQVGLGALMLAILIFRPKGLTGGDEIRWPWPRQAAQSLAAPTAEQTFDPSTGRVFQDAPKASAMEEDATGDAGREETTVLAVRLSEPSGGASQRDPNQVEGR